MKNVFFIFFTFLMLSNGKAEPLKVGVILSPPFVTKQDKVYSGIAVEFWNHIAQGLQQSYTYTDYPSDKIEDAFKDLDRKKIDVLIGPLSLDEENFHYADFSFPYYIDKVVALIHKDYFHNLPSLFRQMLRSLGGFIVTFFLVFGLYLSLLWYYERQYVPTIPTTYRKGLSYLFWTHFLSGWHTNDIPKSIPGKMLLLFKTASFYVVFTLLAAVQFSYLTIAFSKWIDPIQTFSDLEKKNIGTVGNSRHLKKGSMLGLKVSLYPSLKEGIKDLSEGKVKVFVSDLSLADSYLKGRGKEDIYISHFILKYDLYAFAVSPGSPLLRKINEQILFLRRKDLPEKICKNYLEHEVKACEL